MFSLLIPLYPARRHLSFVIAEVAYILTVNILVDSKLTYIGAEFESMNNIRVLSREQAQTKVKAAIHNHIKLPGPTMNHDQIY